MPSPKPSPIDVIIVTATGSRRYIDKCLKSLREAQTDTCISVVTVVDNASSDGVLELIERGHPDVQIVRLSRNGGFGAGVNAGIAQTHAEYVLLLNPDTAVGTSALETLLEAIRADARIGAVGPRLIDLDGIPDHNAKRAFPTPAAALRHLLPVAGRTPVRSTAGGGTYSREDIAWDQSARVDALSGSCMLLRRAAIREVGPMDERYWMYGEDLDYCARLGRAGWTIHYVGDAVVTHVKHGVSGPRRSLRLEWSFHRAMGRFYRRHQAGRNRCLDALVYLGVLLRFFTFATRLGYNRVRSFGANRRV